MKNILLGCILLFTIYFSTAFAGGGMTHMFIAKEAITALQDAKLRHLLSDHLDAYLVGAYYPDSGYVEGTHYGEDSHWDAFIIAFAFYLKETYKDPITENPKLVAFLMGCATHRVSDEVLHWTFYKITQEKDFHGDHEKAHVYGDLGIDLLINLDKNQWLTHPTVWWVPIKDLIAIYHRMGKDQYTADEMIRGNMVISAAGLGERFISAFAYPYLKIKMPWTAEHYYDWPKGGLRDNEQKIIQYLDRLWFFLNHPEQKTLDLSRHVIGTYIENEFFMNMITKALSKGIIDVPIARNQDGSVEFQPPVIHEPEKWQIELNQVFKQT